MFDLITIVTPPLPPDKINHIVWRNGLQTNSKNGLVCYSNEETKNLKQQKGIYVDIGTNMRVKIEGSLHKYYNEISGNGRNNFDMFTMSDAKEAITRLLHDKGVEVEDARVYHYEIGLNLQMQKDCKFYINKLESIGTVASRREFLINPKYEHPFHKSERLKVTGFKGVRKHYKAYDKVHESKDKKRKIIPEGNILRIETSYRRLGNFSVENFFHPDNLYKMIEAFFRDWRTIQFRRDIITPKGTGRAKQHLCLDLMSKGKDEVLNEAKERHNNKSLTDWEYRNIREFTNNDWDRVKKDITFIQSEEEKEYRHLMQVNHTLLRNDEISK